MGSTSVLAGGEYTGVHGFRCVGWRRKRGNIRLSLFWPAASIRECTAFAVLVGGENAGIYGIRCFGRRRVCGSVRLSLCWLAAKTREYTAFAVVINGEYAGVCSFRCFWPVAMMAGCSMFPTSHHISRVRKRFSHHLHTVASGQFFQSLNFVHPLTFFSQFWHVLPL